MGKGSRGIVPAEFDTDSGIIIVEPVISPDGLFVGFRSADDDLVAGGTLVCGQQFVEVAHTGGIEHMRFVNDSTAFQGWERRRCQQRAGDKQEDQQPPRRRLLWVILF